MESGKTAVYVRAIARAGSISAAAAELGISQPALSAALKKAEKQIGSPVFDRATVPLAITDAGRAYLEYADAAAVLKRDLMQKVSDIENLRCGELVVGGVGTFNLVCLPPVIAEFSRLYPNVRICVVDGTAPEMSRKALEGKIDVLVVPLMQNDEAFDYEELLRERIFLCVPPHWPVVGQLPAIGGEGFARIDGEGFKLLEDCPFVTLLEDQTMGKMLKRLFAHYRISPKQVVRANQMLTCLALTMKGVGASLATESALNYVDLRERPALYLPDEGVCTRVLYVARPKNRHVSVAAREFVKILEEQLA